MESFLATLITILLVVYALRWLFSLLAPWLVKAFARRVMRKAGFSTPGAGQGGGGRGKKERRGRFAGSGDDMVLRPRRRQGQSLSDLLGGEYVPFTEI